MGIAVSTIQSLIGQYPISLFTAHHWFTDPPTNSNPVFTDAGEFTGGDLPFGVIYELHNLPSTRTFSWVESISLAQPYGHIVNNAAILGGYGSTVPVEEFILNKPRGMFLFNQPSTTSIILELLDGAEAQLWGLYIDIPFVTPTQPAWTATPTSPTLSPPSFDGTAFAGLSGHGSVAISASAIGARIDVTTVPTRAGEEDGEPVTLFDIGWVNWGDTNTSWRKREFISSASFETFPPQPSATQVLGYSVPADVTITITELLPALGPHV